MSDQRAVPQWEGYLDSLQETLESILYSIEANRRMGVRANIACLEAYDELDRYMSTIKSDLGI